MEYQKNGMLQKWNIKKMECQKKWKIIKIE